jgi:hypothetical protein
MLPTMLPVNRSNYNSPRILLKPGRYRVYGFPPMTGLLLNKWIEVHPNNPPGCYGVSDLEIASTIPNLSHITDEQGTVVWRAQS